MEVAKSLCLPYSYMSAGRLGSKIIVDASTIKVGKTLAFLSVDITDKESGKMIAQGKHTKYIG